jgi:integral membrane protein
MRRSLIDRDALDLDQSRKHKESGSVSPKVLGYVALAETLSWTVLIVATFIKYAFDREHATQIPGMVHGFLFVAFVVVLLMFHVQQKWAFSRTIKIFLYSFIPIGGYFLIDHAVDEEAAPAKA